MPDTDSHSLYGIPFRIDANIPDGEIHFTTSEGDPLGKIVDFKTSADRITATDLSAVEERVLAAHMQAVEEKQRLLYDEMYGVTTTKWGDGGETLDFEKLTLLMKQEQEKRDELDLKLFISMLRGGIKIAVGGYAVSERYDEMVLVIPKSKERLLKKAHEEIARSYDAPWWLRMGQV